MFSLNNNVELRRVTISSLITCIYLPSIITVISYKGLLYSVGNASSCYVLFLIFVAELMKSFYLNSNNGLQNKRKTSKTTASDIAKATIFLIAAMFSFFIGIILFGAPVLEYHEETLMLSTVLTLLTLFPLIAHTGVESAVQLLFGVRSFSRDTIIAMLVNNALLTVCGAWFGAVVIPLDWNTPWQKWPIPCYLGAIGGYLISNVLTVTKVTMMSATAKYPIFKLGISIINRLHISK
ncbi:phosphatidylinositol-glycan biosynthesis class F protein [Danaus plexippus]|nr:phosphatidylinositol-glycan biosynthesis class F protein [Danaus plexippus]